MTFQDSIKICFTKYADFTGRASRPEFWWWFLFVVVVNAVISPVSGIIGVLLPLATFIPSIAVGARRLHDTNRSGWWQLIGLLPIVGIIVLLVFWAQERKSEPTSLGLSA